MQRVVLTGIGVFSALGPDLAAFREALFAGRSAIGDITLFPTDDLSVRIGAEIADYDPGAHFTDRQLNLLDRFAQFALIAAQEAITASGLTFDEATALRTATILGSGAGGQTTQDDNYRRLYHEGRTRLPPFTIPKLMINAPVSQVCMTHGLTGPAFTVASACSSANHAIGTAWQMVRSGVVDVAVTGGTEATITTGTLRAWNAMRILAPDTCRPFSKGRNGLVLGEGAAVFTLESLDHARARGAEILAELAGFGMSSDAWDITRPSVDGGVRAMRQALETAGLDPADVDYINAHGTGTTVNDATETQALYRTFGDHARQLAVSSTKSMHGHALGAAGALELAATVEALRAGVVPPTVNYLEPDPECDLDYVPNAPRERKLRAALSNSFAFGGLNAVLAVRRFEG